MWGASGPAPGDEMFGRELVSTTTTRHSEPTPGRKDDASGSAAVTRTRHTFTPSASNPPVTSVNTPGAFSMPGNQLGDVPVGQRTQGRRSSGPADRSRRRRGQRGSQTDTVFGGSGNRRGSPQYQPRTSASADVSQGNNRQKHGRRTSNIMRLFRNLIFAGDAPVSQTQGQVQAQQQQQGQAQQQLEHVNEEDEEHDHQKIYKNEILGVLICVLITIGIAVGIYMATKPKEDVISEPIQIAPDVNPPEESERFITLRAALMNWSSDPTTVLLDDKSTPQYRALSWLADDDTAQVDSFNRILSRYALATIYYATTGKDWNQKLGFLSSAHECDWTTASNDIAVTGPFRTGVTCNSQGEVVSLNLENNNLEGFIPEEIGALTFLRHLNIASNLLRSLNAALDATESFRSIVQLKDLVSLDVNSNGWDSTLPSSISSLSNIEVLHLENNEFKLALPSELSRLSNLKELYLGENKLLTGRIENIVENMQHLETLDASGCAFTISPELNFPSNLTSLVIGGNTFQGGALSTANLSNLTVLSLANMDGLAGQFPWSSLIEASPSLRELDLQLNNFSGDLPSDIGRFSDLERLLLFRNRFGGILPNSIGDLTSLSVFDIHSNILRGTIPSTLGRMTSLELLDISFNRFSGMLPTEMENMESLASFSLQHNLLINGGDIEFLCHGNGTVMIDQYQNISCSCCAVDPI